MTIVGEIAGDALTPILGLEGHAMAPLVLLLLWLYFGVGDFMIQTNIII